MALPIPKRHIKGLNLLRSLSASSANELLRALESAKVASGSYEMADRIAGKVKSIPMEDLRQIMSLLYGLYHVREYSTLNKNDFLRELLEGVQENAHPKIANNELPGIKLRLKGFMRLKTLENLSKALVLQRRHERVFCEAKIASDVRTVFEEDLKSTPVGAVISHILTIAYHEDGAHREFYVALDHFDLEILEKIVKRAKAKDNTLDELLESSGIARLGF